MYLEHFVGVRVKLSGAKEACLFILGTQNWSWRYTGITGYHRHCVRQGPHTAACTVLLLIVVGWCRGQRGLPRSWILNQHLSLMTPEPGAGDYILDLSLSTKTLREDFKKQAENGLQSRSSENGKTAVLHYGLTLQWYLTGDRDWRYGMVWYGFV